MSRTCLDNPDPVMDSTLGPCTHPSADYVNGEYICPVCGDGLTDEEVEERS